jgi:hypothetical protein
LSLSLLTDPSAVLAAIAEFDELGRDPFLKKYGFGRADRFFLEHNDQQYDAKAIAGVAVGKQHPDRGPLKAAEFSGGDRTVRPKLEELGFRVIAPGFETLRARWEAGGPWTDVQAEWRVAREKDVPALRLIMETFLNGEIGAANFRYRIDSFTKQTKLDGFAGTSGQMFFNLLSKAAPEPDVAAALRAALPAPADDGDCRVRFDRFLAFVEAAGVDAKSRGGTRPALGYVPFFLSFFWEAQEIDRWPIYYPTSRDTLIRHGLFSDKGPLAERYLQFRDRVDELGTELGGSRWDIEAFLWTLNDEAKAKKPTPPKPNGSPAPPDPPEVEDFYEELQLRELIFPDELVTSLILSLITKPFVLLSGISGTGKTQLAVQLAEHLERHGSSQQVEVSPPVDDDANIYIRLTEARLSLGRTNVTRSNQQALALHGGLPDRGTFKEYTVTVKDGPTAQFRLNNIGFADPGRELFLFFFRKPLDEWLRERAKPGDYLHLRLDEDSGIAAAELVSPELETAAPSRHAVVAVKSDWTDPRGLLGYRNPILRNYVETDALELLLQASAAPSEPFVLILDEMNLARVEYYFSDFLSAMELDGGEISLYAETDDDVTTEVPPRVKLPTNVLVIGTVNVDETTFTFSPKVLDRANVLTFNEVDVQRFFSGGGDELASTFRLKSGKPDPGALAQRDGNAKALERARGFQPFSEALTEMFTLLEGEDRPFGYRVLTEVTTFVGLALEHVEGGEDSVWRTALDLQINQKILPKLSGGRELETLLVRLLAFCDPSQVESQANAPTPEGSSEDAGVEETSDNVNSNQTTSSTAAVYPRAAKALSAMLKRLRQTGFVSFFE